MDKKSEHFKKGSVEVWSGLWHAGRVNWVENVQDATDQGQVFEWVKYKFLEEIFPKATPNNSIKSLEVGCGSAGVSAHFSLRGYKATMLDSSQEALKLARQTFRDKSVKGRFVLGNALKLPFADNAFDVVMSFGLLEHFENVQPVINEMARVLKPGGLFFADIVPKRFSVQTVGDIFINVPLIVMKKIVKGRPGEIKSEIRGLFYPPFYENTYSYQEYLDFMRSAGLKNIKMRGNNPFPSIHVAGRLQLLWVSVLIKLMPFWRFFDKSTGFFFDILWPRAWWAWARK